jgi:anaerobic selenocysteine-containing dehydrogenase
MALTRRQFLKWAGATGIGAVVFNGCNVPDEEIQVQSPLQMPEDLVTGRDNYYATVYQSSSGSEGLRIRVMEGRAKKVEGNPDYPISEGKHGVRTEALLQALYHPDRIKNPLAKVGPQGPFRPIGEWNAAVGQLAELLRAADPKSVLLAVSPVRGVLATVVQQFADAYGAKLLGFDPVDQTVLREAMRRVFSQSTLPDFDLKNTNFLLSFGADFLGTWLAPTHFMRGYGEFRQGEGRPHGRGHLVHVESRFSTTAANADDWVYVNPGAEGLLAMSLAYVIIKEGLGDSGAARALTGGRGASALEEFQPGLVADRTGVSAERIVELAHAFADTTNGPSMAIGGGSAGAHTNGLFNLTAIYSLNYLVGSVNKPGGIIFNPTTRVAQVNAAPLKEWRAALDQMRKGEIKVLLVRDANLLHGLPASLDAAGALRNVETIVSFSSFMDETTAEADLVLPGHTPLEEWGSDTAEPGPGYTVVGLQQPVVVPFANTLSFGDVLLQAARQLGLGGGLERENMREAVRDALRPLHQTGVGSVRKSNYPTFEEFWHRTLERGGWWDTSDKAGSQAPAPPRLPQSAVAPEFKGSPASFPFYLVPFESHSIGTGGLAHLPWLQAVPDPVTTVAWGTWVELNPKTAQRLNVREEDLVSVESPTGELIHAPVYVNPAAPPNVVGIPFGQGHTQSSRYAANRGANVFNILDPAQEEETGALAWAATRVRVVKTVRKQRIAKLEGVVPATQLQGQEIIQVVLPK